MERVGKTSYSEIFKQIRNACSIAEQVQFVAMSARREELCDVAFSDGTFLLKLTKFSKEVGVPEEIRGFFGYVGRNSFCDFSERIGTPVSKVGVVNPVKSGKLSSDFCRKIDRVLISAKVCADESAQMLRSSRDEKSCRLVCSLSSVLFGIAEIAYRSVVRVCLPLVYVDRADSSWALWTRCASFRAAKIELNNVRNLSDESRVSGLFCDYDVRDVTRNASLAVLKIAVMTLHYMRDAFGKKEMSLEESGVESLFALAKEILDKGFLVSNKSMPMSYRVNQTASALLMKAVKTYSAAGRKSEAKECFCEMYHGIERFNDTVCF